MPKVQNGHLIKKSIAAISAMNIMEQDQIENVSRECERGRGVVSCGVATRPHKREGTGSGPNLEIIGECGTGGVRGSFLPIEAIRLPSPAGEQPLELRGTRHTPR